MKQKKIGDILYVFQETPYVITEDTDAEVIKIQLEAVEGFKAINNSTINAKIEPFNYMLFTVKRQEWADYVDNYTITVAETSNGTVSVDKTDADPGDEVTITATPSEGYELDTLIVTAGADPVTVTNNKFTMPAANVTVTATFVSAGVVLYPNWFDYDDNQIEEPYSISVTQSLIIYLKDNTADIHIAPQTIYNPETSLVGTFESSDNSILDVSEGGSEDQIYITGLSAGTATITATWPQQELNSVMYAGGTKTLQVIVTS